MRREHISSQSYIDFLKSLGCVFYCAFDAINGTADLINNVQFSPTGYGSCVYNSQYDMYQVTSPSSVGRHIGIWDNGISKLSFPDDNFTSLYTFRRITSASNKYVYGISSNSDSYPTVSSTQPSWNGTGRTNSFPSGTCKVGVTINHSNLTRNMYQNGTLYTTASEYSPSLPSNWNTIGSGIILFQTPSDHPSYSVYLSVSYYIRDVYLFNTVLDLSTIRKIQGYE